jgi:hypothetical protein
VRGTSVSARGAAAAVQMSVACALHDPVGGRVMIGSAVAYASAERGRRTAACWLPVWHWHPVAVGAFVLVADFGVLLAIRMWEHGSFYFPWYNKTFVIGDSICLPLYAVFTAAVLRAARGSSPALRFYHRPSWHVVVIVAAVVFAVGLDLVAVGAGHTSVFAAWRPSKAYHLVVSGVMFYLLVSVLPAALHVRKPYWALGLALLSLGTYLAIATTQIEPMARTSLAQAHRIPERLPLIHPKPASQEQPAP